MIATPTANSVYRIHGNNTVSRRDPLRVIRTRMDITARLVQHLESIDELTANHRKALFVAQMESARSAYRLDKDLAEELSVKALAIGWNWRVSSPALPLHYQALVRLVGFRRAERLACSLRRAK
jgi:hypothetical protein